ncbi:MAG: cyclase family protein [Chloroflexi bacterium]|nr:cyclase family protein [Chloroflexota bacterium]
MDAAAFTRFAEKYKNWGRWGQDDEVGTLNFVTPEHIVQAARLIRKGKVFSLAIPFDSKGPQRAREDSSRFNPIHTMLRTGADLGPKAPIRHSTDDMVVMPLQCATQWDSLAHVIFHGKMYNNRPASLVTSAGAEKNSIDKIRSRPVGRGVLLDIPRYKGVPWLEPGHSITTEDLEGCAAKEKVAVQEGDFLLVRTGHVTMCKSQRDWGTYAGGDRPGLSMHTIPWLYEKKVASVASDNYGVEVMPTETEGFRSPLHLAGIACMGLLLGEIFDLDELAADCAQDSIYEFFFVAPPLPITGAVGSPINPFAIK